MSPTFIRVFGQMDKGNDRVDVPGVSERRMDVYSDGSTMDLFPVSPDGSG